MRKALFVFVCIAMLNTFIFADDNGFKPADKVELKVYFNLAHIDIMSYEGQLEFLNASAKESVPMNKWDVPVAVETHKLFKETSTVEIVFTASNLKVEETVNETELIELANKILENWRNKIKIIAEAKAYVAQSNLDKAREYQKKQEAIKRSTDELNLKIKHAQEKMLEQSDLIDTKNSEIDEIKKTIKDLRTKIHELGEAPQLSKFLEKDELRLVTEVENLDKLKAKEQTYKDRISKFNLEIDNLPLYNPLSEAYMAELAEKAMILNWKPEIIANLGDANKLY